MGEEPKPSMARGKAPLDDADTVTTEDGSSDSGSSAPSLIATDRPPAWKRAIHIYALYGMSIVQTVLVVLSNNPSFWVVRRANVADIGLFLLTVLILIPAVLMGIPYLLGRINATVGWVAHLIVLGGLATLFLVDLSGNIFGVDNSGWRILILSAAAAMLLLIGYTKLRLVRDLILAIAIAPLAITVLFLLNLPPLGANDAPAVSLGVTEDNPVVVVVLDEFSLPVLEDADGSIDASRFPNFARLAATSTWYPMATSVHDGTLFAVPAILTGNLAESEALPIAASHPVNLFTALADTHEMVVYEDVTRLCPDRLCAETLDQDPLPSRLWSTLQDSSVVYLNSIVPHDFLEALRIPGLGIRWRNFLTAETAVKLDDAVGPIEQRLLELSGGERRSADIGQFLDSIDGQGSSLHYFHVDLPHAPYSMLPDGRWYPPSPSVSDVDTRVWVGDEWRRQQTLAKYSGNVGYADLVVGELLDKLESVDMFDDALVVVVSDHGVSFKADEPRRLVTDGNFIELASVPLFIKYPQQTEGVIDDRNVQTVDVFPTIIGALGGSTSTDGFNLLESSAAPSKLMASREGPPISMDLDEFRDRLDAARAEMSSMIVVGQGHDALVAGIGPVPELVGLKVDDLDVIVTGGDVEIEGTNADNVIDTSGYPPAVIVAKVSAHDGEAPTQYALVADGVILGTATPVESSDRDAVVRFFVNPDEVVAAGGLLEVVGISGTDGASFRLIRFS